MRRPTGNRPSFIAALSLISAVSGCGDGSSTLSYTGATSPAILSPVNSEDLVAGAYTGGNSGIFISNLTKGLTQYHFGASRRPRALVLSSALMDFIRRAATGDTLAIPDTAATVTNIPDAAIKGNCGGSATVDGSYDDVDSSLSLSANLNNYCENGTTLSGTVGASGSAVADGGNNINISSISVKATNLTATYGRDSFTVDGALTIKPQAGKNDIDSDILVTIDMLFKDNATSKVYKLENFAISRLATLGTGSQEDISIAGRYYDPDEGYIDLLTTTDILITDKGQWPSSGSIRATGKNSSATLTAQSDTTYRLDVDSDGDGTVDVTENGQWAKI